MLDRLTVHLTDRWSIKKFKLLKQRNPNKCDHKKGTLTVNRQPNTTHESQQFKNLDIYNIYNIYLQHLIKKLLKCENGPRKWQI